MVASSSSELACIDLSGRLLWKAAHGLVSMRHTAVLALPGNVARADVSGWDR